ncbi:MAG: hypothetical protein ABL930_04585 [Pseudobdellovibrio sp.]
MKSVCLLFCALSISNAAKASEPLWLKAAPPPNESHFFFSGISEPQDNLQKAIESARANAISNIIRELFGTKIKMDLKSVETLNTSTEVVKRYGEETQTVQISDLHQIDLTTDKDDRGKQTAYILYSYSKSSYQDEKIRLQSAPDRFSPITLIEVKDEQKQIAKFHEAYPVSEEFLIKQLDFFRVKKIWLLGLDAAYLTQTFDNGRRLWAYGFHVEHIYENLKTARYGLRLSINSLNANYRPDNPNDAEEGSGRGYEVGLSVPTYLFADVQSLQHQTFSEYYIYPELNYLNYDFKLRSRIGYSNASEAKYELRQYFLGIGFGFNMFSVDGWGFNMGTSYGRYFGSHTYDGASLSVGVTYNF